MSLLPRQVYPTYDIVNPSTKKKIKFRPWNVKEQKVLAIAQESQDVSQISNAVKTILENCIQTKDVNVDKLAIFDVEYLFLNIRSRASGEVIEFQVLYPGEEDVYVPVKINIDEIKVTETKGHKNVIDLYDDMKMIMRYPTFEYFIKENFEMPQTEQEKMDKGYELISSCVDKICKGDEVWTAEDVGQEEVIDFLDDLTEDQMNGVEEFLSTMPQLTHTLKVQHPTRTTVDKKTGEEVPEEAEVTLSGIVDFFI
jgi:hypothetical protein